MEWFPLSLMIDQREAPVGGARPRTTSAAFREAFAAAAPRLSDAAHAWLQRLCMDRNRTDLLDAMLNRPHAPAPWENFRHRALLLRHLAP